MPVRKGQLSRRSLDLPIKASRQRQNLGEKNVLKLKENKCAKLWATVQSMASDNIEV